jgi:hypothetical protein
MPTPRVPSRRYQKWDVKFDPTVVSARFTAVKPVAEGNAQDGLIPFANLDFAIAGLLDTNGVTGPDRAKYLGLARKLYKEALRVSGTALDKYALGLKQYWVTTYGADPTICDKVINFVLGYVPSY